jgi:hypothetical protein
LSGLQIQRLLAFLQIFLIELRLPAFARTSSSSSRGARESAEPAARRPLFLAFGVGIDNLKRGGAVFIHHRLLDGGVGAVVVNLFQGKLRADPGSVSAGQIGC